MLFLQCMREIRIHHLRLLLVISQLGCMMLFPIWMYTDVWQIITHLHKVHMFIHEYARILYMVLAGTVCGTIHTVPYMIAAGIYCIHTVPYIIAAGTILRGCVWIYNRISLSLSLSGSASWLVAVCSPTCRNSCIRTEHCSIHSHLNPLPSQLLCSKCHETNHSDQHVTPDAAESSDTLKRVWNVAGRGWCGTI